MDGLESSYTPSNDKLDPSIDLAVNGVSTLCQGTYKVSPGDISGEIHAKAITGGTEATNVDSKLETNHLKEDTAIDLTWKFLPTYQPPDTKKYKMPYALRTIKCRADLQVSELHFTGSISAKIINLFSSMIADTVSDQLNQQLCPLIQKQVDPIVTKALKSANGFLSKYLPGRLSAATSLHDSNHLFQTAKLLVPSQRESATFAAQSTTTLDFKKDTPLLVKYLHAINHFLDCFYASQSVDRGLSDIFDLAEECNGLVNKSLRGILSLILDGLAEIVSIPLPAAAHKIQFAVPKYGEILLDIQDLYIQGLDQLNHLSLFLPVSKGEGAPISNFLTKLQSTTGLNVTADLHITVTAMEGGIFQGDPLQETFHVNFNLSSLSALGDLALAFEKSQFQHIQIGTILDVLPFYHSQHHTENNSTAEEECIIDSIQDANVADLEVQTVLESVTVVPHLKSKVNVPSQKTPSMTLSKKLEEDLDGLLNHVLKLVLNEYQPTLTAAVSGLVKKPLADCLNHWIQEKLEKYENPSWLYSRDKSLEMDELSGSTALSDSKDKRCKGDESIDQDHHQLANFSDVGLLHKLNLYLNKADTIRSINRAIEHAARKFEKKYSSWTFAENTSPSSSWLSKTELPGMSIELVDFTIENSGNLNHIGKFISSVTCLFVK